MDQKLINNSAFCVMPWVHLHIDTNGDIKACCIASKPFGNINRNRLQDLWNGDNINEFRSKIYNNIKDIRCKACYIKEAAGATSLRQHSNEHYMSHFLEISAINNGLDKIKNAALPIYWDIRFSNVCNFRCRTCYHGASSRWFEEAAKLGETMSAKPIIKAIDDVENFYTQLEEYIESVEEIYFAGGEPLIMDEHYRILEVLVKKKSYDKYLRYNTNFSKFSFKETNIFSIWKKFRKVDVSASLDGSGKRGEYLRKEQNWSEVLKNREVMKVTSPSVNFSVAVTVSALNIFHIPDFHKELISLSFITLEDFWIENLLETPAFYSIQILPIDFKLQIKEKFEIHIDWIRTQITDNQFLKYDYIIGQFQSCIHYLFAGDLSHLIPSFISRCKTLDSLRNEKTTDVFPELKFLF